MIYTSKTCAQFRYKRNQKEETNTQFNSIITFIRDYLYLHIVDLPHTVRFSMKNYHPDLHSSKSSMTLI